jgi:hypothetical protein
MSTTAPPLAQGFRFAYPAGLALCVAWPLILQLMLGAAIHRIPEPPPGPVVQQLGYTFTGLTVASGFAISWRWGRTRAGFRAVPAGRRSLVMVREIILYSVLCQLSALGGVLYYGLGGPEHFARGFIALTTVMFFVFVPRLASWREAARGE